MENLYNVITKPIRITNKTASLIDLIRTNDISNDIDHCILYSKTSGYFPVSALFQSGHIQPSNSKTIRTLLPKSTAGTIGDLYI